MKLEIENKKLAFIAVSLVLLAVVGFGSAYADNLILNLATPAAGSVPAAGHSSTAIAVNIPDQGDMLLQDAIDGGHLGAGGAGGAGLGAWNSTDSDQVGGTGAALAHNTVYQASTDGFVVAELIAGHCGQGVEGYTDGSSPPTTLKVWNGSGYIDTGGAAITLPVKANDYWKVKRKRTDGVCWGTLNMQWLPLLGGAGGGSLNTYESTWTSVTRGSTYTFVHSLGVEPFMIQLFVSDTADGSGRVAVAPYGETNAYGLQVVDSDSSEIKIRANVFLVNVVDAGGIGWQPQTAFVKVKAITS